MFTGDGEPSSHQDQVIEELRDNHAGCLRQIESLKREIEGSAAAARDARDELEYFVYAASHDLQQPLRAIGTHAQLLQREYPNDQRAREFTAVIIEGAAQMNALIRDLLTYSRTGNVSHPVLMQLNASYQWALYNVATIIQESGARVRCGELPEALADEKQMVAVFEQLLTNAIRYRSAEPPEVEIESATDDQYHTISVQDNGVGIKPEYHEKVFEPFKRLVSKQIPGSGLGLAICRKILRAHGGRIWVESDGEHGSRVMFTIPV